MFPLVEFCETNLAEGSQVVMDALESLEDVDVMMYSCLSECTLCAQKPFCFFEGERLAAETPAQLLHLVKDKLVEWHEEYL
ncbi:hypothetical protein DOK78_001056 [Enterococcus sp. DIV2402]|uniref:DUF1450 domain-containing protein n=1 Tax=Candidatus Enterococcus lowellii TaxID=2230877 RepID=A0ABZ2SN59_9ENTE|nr:DUF1450 domain-containing protein [Enterococcus sp. DIV2402]MBO0465614.1 DUF1450 domain-containing protein [Enterococcus sp. DIV2402]